MGQSRFTTEEEFSKATNKQPKYEQSEGKLKADFICITWPCIYYTNTECDAVVKDEPFPKSDNICKTTRSCVLASALFLLSRALYVSIH